MIFELFKISSNVIFYLCLLYIWIYFIVRVMGETGIDIVLILSTVGIVLSLLGYIFEFLFTGLDLKSSVCGSVFLYSFFFFCLFVVSGFLMYPMFRHKLSMLEELLKKYNLNT